MYSMNDVIVLIPQQQPQPQAPAMTASPSPTIMLVALNNGGYGNVSLATQPQPVWVPSPPSLQSFSPMSTASLPAGFSWSLPSASGIQPNHPAVAPCTMDVCQPQPFMAVQPTAPTNLSGFTFAPTQLASLPMAAGSMASGPFPQGAVSEFAKVRSPLGDAASQADYYLTRDVFTDPPTLLRISCNGSTAAGASDPSAIVIPESAVIPTEGWIAEKRIRQDGPQAGRASVQHKCLSICFSFSFGKCRGKNGSDPFTCQQIHIDPAYLKQLRLRVYTLPLRGYFCRTVRAHIDPTLRDALQCEGGEEASSTEYLCHHQNLQFFEYKLTDVHLTEGLARYEAQFRASLLAGSVYSASELNVQPNGTVDQPPHKGCGDVVLQCSTFAMRHHCPLGATCPFIHADLIRSLTRDRVVMNLVRNKFQRECEWSTPNLFNPIAASSSSLSGTWSINGPAKEAAAQGSSLLLG